MQRMQNCGSMRAEACSDRVNTPRIVSFSKARMFHGSRSSAIPVLFALSKFRYTTTMAPAPGNARAISVLFPSFLTTFPMPVLECVFLFALFRERSWPSTSVEIEYIYLSASVLVQRQIKFIMPRVALFRDVSRWKRRPVVVDKWQVRIVSICWLSGIILLDNFTSTM